jgi:hypothetical protein
MGSGCNVLNMVSGRLNNDLNTPRDMNSKALILTALMILVTASPLVTPTSAVDLEDIEVMETVVNPANNHTYHLLSASSWSDAASVARSLDGFLVTIDDAEEDQWIFDTFALGDNTTRHLWTGLSDAQNEGDFRWHDGTPFLYRNWGEGQPGSGNDEDYIHITGTNMGTIEPATWNDLEDDPQYFPVYGVVEIGEGADYALRFDGVDDHIFIDAELPVFDGGYLEIEAWVNVPDTDGIQFITMLGDYGWGLYLNNGYLAYSNEYSMSGNPISNVSIQESVWTHIKVVINTQSGGEFFIDNTSVGLIDVNDSQTPAGDFGSNDCFQSGEDCDELYIGRMGAGCDCNYFKGMMDDVVISGYSQDDAGNGSLWKTDVSAWTFPEGEGDSTEDLQGLSGEIIGASWVMPDGTIIAQAMEIENDEYYEGINAEAGDTLLFFMDIPENTRELSVSMFSWEFDEDFEDEIEYEVYVSLNEIPSAWDHDYQIETFDWGLYVYEYFEWPEEGVYWITVSSNIDINDLTINAYWEEAPEPPELDEMIELNDGISITGQTIRRNSGDMLYYYVDLQDELAELRVNTWGGPGDCELHIALGSLPTTDFGWDDDFLFQESSGRQIGGQTTSDHSYNPGNDETVQIFDAQPGIYYIVMDSYGGCREVTIQADFTYSPDNVEPESAIELSAGISYGPLSGFAGLDQYFYIDVPVGTERLEVDLSSGDGEAKLMMRLDQYPTWTTYDKHSNAPGAGDKVGFNDPTPGRWYILLGSEEYYSRIDITASFTDRYVWTYDGEPIQLFNEEEVSGISAPEGEELYFFIDLGDDIAMELVIKTWGGEGDLGLFAEAENIDWGGFGEDDGPFNGGGGPGGRQAGGTTEYQADEGGADEEIRIFFATGRIDITMAANADIEDISILAIWEGLDEPRPGPDPDPDPDPEEDVIIPCDEYVEELFAMYDTNNDGDISKEELDDLDDEGFEEADINRDGVLDLNEAKMDLCSCGNELMIAFDQSGNDEISIEAMSSIPWKNEFDFFEMDRNQDLYIDLNEIEDYSENCVTTYDPLDRDGDGTPDDKDAFPDDASEDTDTDGDGVGDNSDIFASVDNDVVWVSASMLGIILVTVLGYLVIRSKKDPEYAWESQRDAMSEALLSGTTNPMESSMMSDMEVQEVPPPLDLGTPMKEVPADMIVADLFE